MCIHKKSIFRVLIFSGLLSAGTAMADTFKGFYSGGIWAGKQIVSDVTIAEGKYTDCIAEVEGVLVDTRANIRVTRIKCNASIIETTGTVSDSDKVTGLPVQFREKDGIRVAKNIPSQTVYLNIAN
jgi:hypothetical protein